jgi:hypothetical protein
LGRNPNFRQMQPFVLLLKLTLDGAYERHDVEVIEARAQELRSNVDTRFGKVKDRVRFARTLVARPVSIYSFRKDP